MEAKIDRGISAGTTVAEFLERNGERVSLDHKWSWSHIQEKCGEDRLPVLLLDGEAVVLYSKDKFERYWNRISGVKSEARAWLEKFYTTTTMYVIAKRDLAKVSSNLQKCLDSPLSEQRPIAAKVYRDHVNRLAEFHGFSAHASTTGVRQPK